MNIKKLIEWTPASTILRTDIRKIKGVTQFPWHSKHKNVLIVGDAANATAPNLAQGAGLAIETAWDLVAMVDFQRKAGVHQFMEKRRKRAETVQGMADLVAKIGQLGQPKAAFRDFLMSFATKHFKSIEQQVFEYTVRYSLGGNTKSLHWMAPLNQSRQFIKQSKHTSLLEQIIGPEQFKKLPKKTQIFRSQLIGSGEATVSVESGIVGKVLGLSSSLKDKNFGAYVDTYFDPESNTVEQKWTRVFNEGSKGAVLHSTIHRATPYFGESSSGLVLTETLGIGFLTRWLRFGYDTKINDDAAYYRSIGMWFYNFKLPIPKWLLLSSEWVEHQSPEGWNFEGSIKYPRIIGGASFFTYKGQFRPKPLPPPSSKRVVIAGGSGFVGKAVAKTFFKAGWHVTILSRSPKRIYDLPFAKVEQWDPEPSSGDFSSAAQRVSEVLKEAEVVINLAGQNPSGLRWTSHKKKRILESRLKSIDLLAEAIDRSNNKDLVLLQSTAVGGYGSRKDELLTEQSPLSSQDTFRINCVKQMEERCRQKCPKAILTRLGHVLGSQGVLLGYLKLFSFFRGKKYGAGGQYMPWIHIEDVGNAMLHIANKPNHFSGKIVNLASPQHHTYDSIYQIMGQLKNRTPLIGMPEWILKLMIGEMSSVILDSQRVHPSVLIEDGFDFEFASLKKALTSRDLL